MEALNGQDVYFLGFPYGQVLDIADEFNLNFPIAFCRKAIVSNMTFIEGRQLLILDGRNNAGFSGGPVVWAPLGSFEYKVAAVISGFRYVNEPIYDGDEPTVLSYQDNTGLVIAHGIKAVTDLIDANPNGFAIPDGA